MTKRCFNTSEAMTYLGVHRRFFETNLMPTLRGKGIKAGTSIVYERVDLDDAWDRYKLTAGSERANSNEGVQKWDVLNKAASTRKAMEPTRLMPVIAGKGFANAVSRVTRKQQTI